MKDNKKRFIKWVNEHKQALLAIGISVPTLVFLIVGLKNKNMLVEVWRNLQEELKKANMHNSRWFESVSDAELEVEREKVRLAYCSAGDDFGVTSTLQSLLWRFDKEMSKRAWGNETPHASSIHREHGRYLPN